ncbi:Oligopeptidase A [compost metagenome]
MTNPLLDFSGLARFDEIRPEHVGPAIERLLADAEAAVKTAETISPVTWSAFIDPLDDATERLGRAWNQVSHMQSVVNTPELRAAYNETLPAISRFYSSMGQNQALFEQYRRLAAAPEAARYDEPRQKLIENALRGFRLGGAELPEKEKARFAEIKEELSAVSARFSENVLDATDAFALYVEDEAELSGLPADVRNSARAAAEAEGKTGWKLTLQAPVMVPVLTYADNRDLRAALYRASGVRASEFGPAEQDNSDLIRKTLRLRRESAALLGYESYADYSLVTTMAQSSDAVLTFLKDLSDRALPHARQDRLELERFAAESLALDPMEPWDVAYVSEKLKQARYALSAEEVKAYFTEPRVIDGLFQVVSSLYGLKAERSEAPVWHEDARFYRLVDADNRLVGEFYLDLYARSGKRGGAWMDVARNRRDTAGSLQTPVVYLVCNFGRGADGKPATFSHDEVITLFHEMGHGLHQLLTEVGDLGVSGLNGVEWDAVELPSQFMENFCWEFDRLEAMTAHAETGLPLPRDLFERMIKARNFQSGMQFVRQLEFSLFDMRIHIPTFDPERDEIMPLLDQVRREVAVNPMPEWHRFPNSFSHIFAGGYAAGYYSYKWAEVLSADAYAAFEESPDDLAGAGARFRAEVLSRGGSRTAARNFEAFRGRPPEIDALLRHNGLAA